MTLARCSPALELLVTDNQSIIFLSNYYVFFVINWSKFFKQVDKCKNEGMTEGLLCFHPRSGFFAVLW